MFLWELAAAIILPSNPWVDEWGGAGVKADRWARQTLTFACRGGPELQRTDGLCRNAWKKKKKEVTFIQLCATYCIIHIFRKKNCDQSINLQRKSAISVQTIYTDIKTITLTLNFYIKKTQK